MGPSILEFLLLGLLDQDPSSGYDLRKSFVSSPLRHFSDSPGSIYPALRRLTERGWINAQKPDGSRNRQVFKINKQGRIAFISWLKRRVIPNDALRPELLLLRFALMGQALTQDEVKTFLGEFGNELEAHITSLKIFYAKNSDSFSLTGRLSFEYGLKEYRTRLLWTQEVKQTISRSKKWPLY